MCLKGFSLLTLFLAIAAAELTPLNCVNKDASACKIEFVKKIDTKFRDYFLSITKSYTTELIDAFEKALNETNEGSRNAELLKDSIKSMKDDLAQFDANKDDYAKLHNLTKDVENAMQPHLMHAPADQKTIPELEQLLEKYNYTKILERVDINEFMQALSKLWQESLRGLRPIDFKEFPEYNAINEIGKQIAVQQDEDEFKKLGREFFTQLRKFCKIPSVELLVFDGKKM